MEEVIIKIGIGHVINVQIEIKKNGKVIYSNLNVWDKNRDLNLIMDSTTKEISALLEF